MAELSAQVAESIRERIHRDLKPSLLTIYGKSGFAVLLGGLASLLVCGQFGVGMTHASMHFTHTFHFHPSNFASAVMCGVVFAVIPPFFLRLLCSPLQFRVIARQSYHVGLVWIVGLGAILAHHGEMATKIVEFVVWCTASVVTFQLLTRLIDRFGGSWTLIPNLKRAQ